MIILCVFIKDDKKFVDKIKTTSEEDVVLKNFIVNLVQLV